MRFYLPMNKKCWFSGMKCTCRPSGRRAEVGLGCGFPPARAKTMRISANSAPPPAPAPAQAFPILRQKSGKKRIFFYPFSPPFLYPADISRRSTRSTVRTEREWADSGGWLAHAAIRFPIPFPRRPEANFMTCRGGRRREAHRDLLLFPFPPGP